MFTYRNFFPAGETIYRYIDISILNERLHGAWGCFASCLRSTVDAKL